MNWKVGDRAIVNYPRSPSGHHGKACTVLRTDVAVVAKRVYFGIEVDLPCTVNPNYEYCVYEPHNLIPIDDDDGREVTTWDKCVWQPKQTVLVEQK